MGIDSYSPISELENWYAKQTNGDWEHSYGVEIGTLDNPGWTLAIDLAETDLVPSVHGFEKIEYQGSDGNDWYVCGIEGAQFKGYCGPKNLGQIIDVFLDWKNKVSANEGRDSAE